MFDKETTETLYKALPELPRFICERSLSHDIDDLVNEIFPGMRYAVIDDHDTSDAFGNRVARALKRSGNVHVTLERHPSADERQVEHVRQRSAPCDVLVAVGSGTVNDLCKYAAFLDNKPYIVFPTAASMNGYLSANASISQKGFKKTLAGRMPAGVFCDLSVIAGAPARLNRSGLGDSLARPTAQADWLMSHMLLNTAYDETPFTLLQPLEMALFNQARGISLGDPDSIALLIKTLLLSGLGMTIAKGSYPASQGEHMIAHSMDMLLERRQIKSRTLHGEEIGVTTLAMAKMQESMLRRLSTLKPERFAQADIAAMYGETIAAEAKAAFAQKEDILHQALPVLHIEAGQWETIAGQLERVMLPSSLLQSVLEQADAPITPKGLGWAAEDYHQATAQARYLRERFTFLDLQ